MKWWLPALAGFLIGMVLALLCILLMQFSPLGGSILYAIMVGIACFMALIPQRWRDKIVDRFP